MADQNTPIPEDFDPIITLTDSDGNDVDYEFLNDPDILQIVVGGPRYADHRLRLLMAGVAPEKISCCDDEMDAVDLVEPEGIDKVYILYDNTIYDLSFRIADKMVRRLTEAAK